MELYKKYRPKTWNDVIGQDNIVEGLKKAVLDKKIPTAYAFFGGPGTGKTTCALILAKALNCDNLDSEGNPCNECHYCKAIDSKSQLGVDYISMANNGSVEDIRKIVAEARLAQPVKHQIKILDEVQNLSSAAFDSLLIPLESEQMKTLFILCSTNPEKIKPAVLSRCQVRQFYPVDVKTLANNLLKIAKQENLKVTKEQIISAVKSANGSVRNSISNLETILSTGSLPDTYSVKIIDALLTKQPENIFKLTKEMSSTGQNFVKATEYLYEELSDILLHKGGVKVSTKTEELSNKLTLTFVINSMDILGNAMNNMSNNVVDNKILLEVALTKILIKLKQNK